MKNFNELYNKTKQELPDEFRLLETTNHFSLSGVQLLILIVLLPILVIIVPTIIFESHLLFIDLLAGYIAFFFVVLFVIGTIKQKQANLKTQVKAFLL